MIQVTNDITLQPILTSDSKELYALMEEIYPPAYHLFWKDDCSWYINSQYSQENVLQELNQQNAEYYFIEYKGKKVGNFRFIWDEKLERGSSEKEVKLHRIYLHKNIQGKGIGKLILQWLEKKAIQKKYEILWLDAMNKKEQAFRFYEKLGYSYYSHNFLDFDLLKKEYRKMSQLYKKLSLSI